MQRVLIGCSGWNYRDWREAVYPAGVGAVRWLEHYATLFDTVEVNATFYRLPSPQAVERWVDQTPDGFVFAIKASRYLTHVKRLTSVRQGVKRLFDSLAPLSEADKLGPVLWQLPETFHRDDKRLAAALRALPRGRHCFEFRHESWFCEHVYALLRDHGAALVIADHPERGFQAEIVTADFTYLRFHHGSRGREGNYSGTELEHWAAKIAAWRRTIHVYAYFNNDWNAFAPRNAQSLARLLSRAT